jgi:hypothetical protein
MGSKVLRTFAKGGQWERMANYVWIMQSTPWDIPFTYSLEHNYNVHMCVQYN